MIQLALAQILFILVNLIPIESQKVQSQILVPEGMPIKLKITWRKDETNVSSCIINRLAPDKGRAMILVLFLDKNGKLR